MALASVERGGDRWAAAREAMVAHQLRMRGLADPRVLDAMSRVPRHAFVPGPIRDLGYADRQLPIGFGQTISAPVVIARVLQALELGGDERVLEVGTGSGYQTALLSRLAREVHSVEIVGALAEQAAGNLAAFGIDNVAVVVGDGAHGYPPAAPFDAIVVAGACAELPCAILAQLAPGGRLVIPIGPPGAQRLLRVRKRSGSTETEDLGACAYAPLLGDCGCR